MMTRRWQLVGPAKQQRPVAAADCEPDSGTLLPSDRRTDRLFGLTGKEKRARSWRPGGPNWLGPVVTGRVPCSKLWEARSRPFPTAGNHSIGPPRVAKRKVRYNNCLGFVFPPKAMRHVLCVRVIAFRSRPGVAESGGPVSTRSRERSDGQAS